MDDGVLVEEVECVEDLDGHDSDEVEGEASEVVVLEEVVEVDVEELEDDALGMRGGRGVLGVL